LLAHHRSAEIDASYAGYDEHPPDEPDEWGAVAACGRWLVSEFPARGEVWWCEMPDIGRRPVVVLSRDAAIPRLRRKLVAPSTTTIRGLASEVVLEPRSDPIPRRRSAVNLDSTESVSVAVLVSRLGRLADTQMRAVCEALEVAVDCSR
jgi:mRNA interferase MazF